MIEETMIVKYGTEIIIQSSLALIIVDLQRTSVSKGRGEDQDQEKGRRATNRHFKIELFSI